MLLKLLLMNVNWRRHDNDNEGVCDSDDDEDDDGWCPTGYLNKVLLQLAQ